MNSGGSINYFAVQTSGGHEASIRATTKRLRQVTAYYSGLRGLMLVPFAPAFVAICVWEMLLPERRDQLGSVLFGKPAQLAFAIVTVLIGAALVALVPISAYYRHRFGSVKPTLRTRLVGGLTAGLGALGFNLALNFSGFTADPYRPAAVNVSVLIIAAAFGLYWWLSGRFLTHHLVLAALGVVIGIAPLLGIGPVGRWWYLREATLYMALIAGIGGYLDHRTLERSLGGNTRGS
ncbi:MAG: hypothetical protein M3077_06555 [Candidatus Dormibacteraeota bacterium]|nr:hypothetical protein [Candidatus Dormibacteraeota bacterium]